MAVVGEWRGGVTSHLPSTSWAGPSGLFPSEARNDGSTYSFDDATGTLTLPSAGSADGYLITAAVEWEDTSGSRHNPSMRFEQTGGAGNFSTGPASGYSRNNTEDRAYVSTWGFIDAPSSGATIQLQTRRDVEVPTGGTVRSTLKVVPLYYSNVGVYSGTPTVSSDTTTPARLTGISPVYESDTDAIEMDTSTTVGEVTLKGENKRYLVLGGLWFNHTSSFRTQRWYGLTIDGAQDDTAKGYAYLRNSSNSEAGQIFTQLVATNTDDRTLSIYRYRGDPVGSFPNSGADSGGGTGTTEGLTGLVVIELHDEAEVFVSNTVAGSSTNFETPGSRLDIPVGANRVLFDSASYTAGDSFNWNAEQDHDLLFGANVSGGYWSDSAARATVYAALKIAGVDDTHNFAGNYGRGNEGSSDAWGWSANLLGAAAVGSGDTLGLSGGKIAGGEAGPIRAFTGWTGFWGVNLDTIQATGGSTALNIDSAEHDHFADSPLTTASGLEIMRVSHVQMQLPSGATGGTAVVPDSASHVQSSGDAEVSFNAAISTDNAVHNQNAGQPNILASGQIFADDVAHAVESQTATTVFSATLAGNDALHGQSATTPLLAASVTLTVSHASHDHFSDTPATSYDTGEILRVSYVEFTTPYGSGVSAISPKSLRHPHTADELSIHFKATIVAQDAAHSQAVESPNTSATSSITPNEGRHSHLADNVIFGFVRYDIYVGDKPTVENLVKGPTRFNQKYLGATRRLE